MYHASFRQLQSLVLVARHESVSRAADALLVARQQLAGDGGTDGAGVTVGGGGAAQRRQGPAYGQSGVGECRVARGQVQRFGVEQYAVQAQEDHVDAHVGLA